MSQLTETRTRSTVHDSTKIPRRPNWRRPGSRWQNNDLTATTAQVSRDPINEECHATLLHHVDRTDTDRSHQPTMPALMTEVRPRVRSALRL
ncbi:hypothetical protein BHE74_00057943, partial [Ensete ventricosum]